MSCQANVCTCDSGMPTPDKTFCLQKDEKLLGQACSYDRDQCYQKACKYSSSDIFPA